MRVRHRDLVGNSPVLAHRVGGALSLEEMCRATMTTSDDTAANLLLSVVGGPEGLTAWLRSLGDAATRLDRVEPALNMVDLAHGEQRDTSTPAAMVATVAALTVGGALSVAGRARLIGWMREATTGLGRLRAGLPEGWQAGDKTGTGPDGPTNDVAVAWPPGRAPLVIVAFYDRPGHTMDENSAVLTAVGRIVAG